MSELFKTIPKSLSAKKTGNYKSKFQTTIMSVGRELFIDQMNANLPPINRRRLIKRGQLKEENIKEKIMKANYHWNG